MTRTLLPLFHLPVFLLGSLLWVLLLGVGVAALLLASGQDPSQAEALLSPAVLGGLTIVQTTGLAAWAGLLSLAIGLGPRWLDLQPGDATRRLRDAMVLRRPSLVLLAAALLGGLVVWTLPSWAAEQLRGLFPGHLSTLDLVTRGLGSADPLGRLLMTLAVAGSAPLFEEVIFRGYVYRVLEVGSGPFGAVVGSTLLFAAYHLDPVHVLALLPTAAFLGFLRWRSGSLWPPILAHAVNNGLGVLAVQLSPDADPTSTLSLPVALAGFAGTLVVVAVGHRLAPRAPDPAGNDLTPS